MKLVPKEILMSHLQRSEGAEEVSLPIDFFRDLLYQAMPRTWVGLTQDELNMIGDSMRTWNSWTITDVYFAIEAKLKEKNT
jgi:hypothetical protein